MKRFTRRAAVVFAIAAALLSTSTAAAQAGKSGDDGYDRDKSVFAWHLGDKFIADAGLPTESQATADNGDVLTIHGTGAFSLHPKAASGGGTFVHHVAATGEDFTGTFQVRNLLSFENYGNGVPQGLPDNFFGGKLVLQIDGTPDLTPWVHQPAKLTIFCTLGTVPAGIEEGINLKVKNGIDFDEIVHESGANVYVKLN